MNVLIFEKCSPCQATEPSGNLAELLGRLCPSCVLRLRRLWGLAVSVPFFPPPQSLN